MVKSAHIGYIDHVHVEMVQKLWEPVAMHGREKKRASINLQIQKP